RSASTRAERRAREADSSAGWWKRRRARKQRRLAAMSPRRRVWRRVGIAFTWFLALFATGLLVLTIAFYQLSKVPRPTDLRIDQVATITYSDGSELAKIGDTNRSVVPLARVPEHVRWAVLAAEDRGFYTEGGVSIRGTARAALNNLKGGDAQGGSGITQQYVKNAYLNFDRTLSRKLRQLAIAVKIDRQYSKDQILEWYLNTIYFGRGAYGIEAAAQAYFGVDVNRLSVTQGAMLAGIIQSPDNYDPAIAKPLATQRWNYVLDGMVTIKKLDPATRARETFPKTVAPKPARLGGTGPAAHIVAQVKAELSKVGIDPAVLNTGGLTIRTTVDRKAQDAAQSVVSSVYGHLTQQQKKDKLREALVAVNPATGGVLAYYGGANGVGVDYAQAWRQPGSSFKPFTLAAVLQANVEGKKPALAINSVVDGSQPYQSPSIGRPIFNDPGDSGYSYPQPITNAMKVSLNTVFARLADRIGPDAVAATARAAGVPAVKTSSAYSAAGQKTLVDANGHANATIGYGGYAVRPIDQATAFATIADGGVRHDSYLIQKVTDSSGKVLYTHKDAGKRVLDARVANDTTVTMNQVASWSNDPLDNGRPSAAKTGTVGIDCPKNYANAGAGCNSDAWMVGFTPQVSAAVWTGNDRTSVPAVNSDGGPLYGANMPGRAWKRFMDTYLADAKVQPVATQQEIMTGTDQTSSAPSTQPSTTAPSTRSSSPRPSTTAPSTPPSSTPSTTRPSTPPSSTTRLSSPPSTTASSTGSSSPPTKARQATKTRGG
ncbi:MAG: penicillin-binding protein, partial [Actinomycetota bacterium]|nr:penicillin-binding protein [Actinomycetota bacterium]